MKRQTYIFPVAIFLVLLVFVVYPMLTVLVKSLEVNGEFSLEFYTKIFTNSHRLRLIWGSVLLALGSATFSTLLGGILAVTIFKTELPGRRFLTVAVVLPMILPGFVTSLSYIFLFGRNGLITYKLLHIDWNIYSWRSVLILQTLGFTTTTFFLISAVLVGVDRQVEDAARNLGASEWDVLTTVTLPLIRPGIVSAALLAFLRSMADFGTPYIVGGRFNTLATASYTQLIGRYNTGMASALSTLLLLLCFGGFFLYTYFHKAGGDMRFMPSHGARKSLRLPTAVNGLLWGISAVFAVVIVALLISVLLAAFTTHLGAGFSLTLEHFKFLPQRGWNSTRNTLMFATLTSVLMSFLGITAAYLVTRLEFWGRRGIDFLATLPFAIPGTFMGVGYALAFSRLPLMLSGTWAIVVACTVIRELPLGLRASASVLAQQDRSIEEASANLGASRLATFFRIIVPLARPALLVSAIYAFIATVKTLGAIIFLITPANKVLSADVFEATVRGDVGDAAALSVVVMFIAALGVLAIYTLSLKRTILFHLSVTFLI